MVAARYRLPEGPPLVTMPRDVDETVAGLARAAYGAAGRAAAAKAREALAEQPPRSPKRRNAVVARRTA